MAGGIPNRSVSRHQRGKYNNKINFVSGGISARNKRRLAKKKLKRKRGK